MSVSPLDPRLAAGRPVRREHAGAAALGVLGVALLAWMVSHAQTVLTDSRVANPHPPADAGITWAGRSTTGFWVPIFYAVTFLVMALMIGAFVRHRRRTGARHPALPVFIGLWVGFAGDPLFNWAMYCNYHPGLLHWPTSWSLFNVAPNVEPLWILIGAYHVFFLGPAMLGFALHRRLLARAGDGAWVRRHQVLSLFGLVAVFGCVMDVLMEMWMLNMNIYKYTQIAGPRVVWGHGSLQVFEIAWIGLLIALYAVLLHRDDAGATVSARLASRVGLLRRLRLGEVGTAVVIVTASLAVYGGFFTALRETGQATRVSAGSYPFRASKTYDPDGRMQAAHQPGPFFGGTWCTSSHCGDH